MADYSNLSLDQLGELLRTEQQKDAQRGWLTPERAAQYQQVFGLFEKVKGQQQFFAARDANRAQTGGIPALGPDFVPPEAGIGFSFGPAQWDSFGNLRELPRAATREAILSVPSMGQALGRQALSALSSPFAPQNVGARLAGIEPQYPGTEAIPGYQAAEDLKTGMRGSGMLATPEAEQGSFTAQFGAGVGSVLPQVGLAFATQGAGLAPEAAGFLSAAMGGLQSSQGVYDEAIQRGMDPTKAQQASSAAGAFTGLTSVVPGMYAQQRLARAMMPGAAAGPTGFIEQTLARGAATKLGAVGAPIISGGIEEGLQETGDQLFQNWLLGKPISSDLAETMVISTTLGSAMGSSGSVGAIKELETKTKDAEATANREKAMQVGQALSQVNTQEELGKLLSSLPQDVRENSDVQMMVRVRAEQIMSAAALDPTMAGMDTGTGFQVEGVPDPLAQSQVDLNPLAPEIEQMAEMSDVPNVPLTPEAEQQSAADSQQAAPEYAQQQRLEAEQEARTQEAIDAQMDAEIADRKQQLFETQRRERETAKLERQMARDDKKTKAIESAGISQEIQTENDLAVQAKEEALSDLTDPMLQHLVDNAPSMVTKRAAMNLLEKRQRPTIAPGAEPGAKTEPTAQKPPDGLPFAPPVDDDIPPRPPPSGPAPTEGPPFDTSPPLDNKDDMTQPMPAPPAGRIRREPRPPAESVAAPQPTPSQPATTPAETPASTPQQAATEPDEGGPKFSPKKRGDVVPFRPKDRPPTEEELAADAGLREWWTREMDKAYDQEINPESGRPWGEYWVSRGEGDDAGTFFVMDGDSNVAISEFKNAAWAQAESKKLNREKFGDGPMPFTPESRQRAEREAREADEKAADPDAVARIKPGDEPGKDGPKFTPKSMPEEFPRAGAKVDGREVGENVPNTSSIGGWFDEQEEDPGIREIPMEGWNASPKETFYAADDIRRAERLAEQIKESGRIDPLIVGVGLDGEPFIIEGVHRLAALHLLGAKSFPAVVVREVAGGAKASTKTGGSAPTRITEADLQQMRDEALKAVGIDPKFVEQLRANPNSAADQRALEAHGKSGDVDLAGMFMDSAITIALDQSAEEAIKTNRHEIGHAFLELLRKANPALAVAVIEDIGQKHPKTGLETKAQRAARLEEAFSDTLAAWWSGSYKGPRPALLKAFQMIRGFIDRIGAKLREMGFTKAADVLGTERGARNRRLAKAFHEAAEGKYAPKQAKGESDAKAAPKPPGVPLRAPIKAEDSPLYEKRTAAEAKAITPEEATKALQTDATAKRILAKGLKPEAGQRVGIRLNINVLKNTGVAVQSIHEGAPGPLKKMQAGPTNSGFYSGEVIDYQPVVTLTDAYFNVHQGKREEIASGGSAKMPMASVDGEYVDTAEHSFDGVEFHFNPAREHLFVDKLGRALRHADEVTIVGNKAIARGEIEYQTPATMPKPAGPAPTRAEAMPDDAKFSPKPDQTETPAFRKWFGDSKVVDADGKPLVAYHGTTGDFAEFDTNRKAPAGRVSKTWNGDIGTWFTAKSLHDANYDDENAEGQAASYAEDPSGAFPSYRPGANLRPSYLSIQNPMEFEGWEDFDDHRRSRAYSGMDGSQYKAALIAAGYDGIVIRNSETDGNTDRDDWVAFEPTQIKSATGNSGAFDATNPDIRYSPKPPVSMSPGAEFTISHGPQGDRKARYVEFKDGKHHYEYWSDTDQKWKPESRSDDALRKAMFTAPRTFTSAAQVPVSPQVQKGAQTMNALLAQYGIPPVTPAPAIPGQSPGAPLPSPGPMPGPAPANGVTVTMSSTPPPATYSKWWRHALNSGAGYVSTLGRAGKMLADYVQLARHLTASISGAAHRDIYIAVHAAKKAGEWSKGAEENLLLVMEKHDIPGEIAKLQAEIARTPASDQIRHFALKMKLDQWTERQAALTSKKSGAYTPTTAPASVQNVADAISKSMADLYAMFRKVALDKAAGVRKDYAPHYVADWVLEEARKGGSPKFAAILDDTARRIIAAQQAQIATGKAKGPVSTMAEARKEARDFFDKETANNGDGQLTKRMGSFELKRSDILDPAFLDYSIKHLEHYFRDGALRLAQYAVLSESANGKITKTPDQAIKEALGDIGEDYGNGKAEQTRASTYIEAANAVLSTGGEDELLHKALNVATGAIVLFRLVNVATQIRNWLGAMALTSMRAGVTRTAYGQLMVWTPGFVPGIGPMAKAEREKGIRSGAIPGAMTRMLYELPTTADSAVGKAVQKAHGGLLNAVQGSIEKVNRFGTQSASSVLAQALADIARGGNSNSIQKILRNTFEFGPILGLSQKNSAKEAERLLKAWFKMSDEHIAEIKSHPTGRLDQIPLSVKTQQGAKLTLDEMHTLDDWSRRAGAEELNFIRHPDFLPVIASGRTFLIKQGTLFLGYGYNANRQALNDVGGSLKRGNIGPAGRLVLGSAIAGAIWGLWRERVMKQDDKRSFETEWKRKLFWRTYDSLMMIGVYNALEHPLSWANPDADGVIVGATKRAVVDFYHEGERAKQHVSGDYGIGYVGAEIGHTFIQGLEDQISLFNDARKFYRARHVTKNTIDRARFAASTIAKELQDSDGGKFEFKLNKYDYELDKIVKGIEAGDPAAMDKAYRDAVEVRAFGEAESVKVAAQRLNDSLAGRSPLGKISSSLENYRVDDNPKLKAFEERMIAAGKGDDAKAFLAAHEYWMSCVVAASAPWKNAPGIVPQLRPKE